MASYQVLLFKKKLDFNAWNIEVHCWLNGTFFKETIHKRLNYICSWNVCLDLLVYLQMAFKAPKEKTQLSSAEKKEFTWRRGHLAVFFSYLQLSVLLKVVISFCSSFILFLIPLTMMHIYWDWKYVAAGNQRLSSECTCSKSQPQFLYIIHYVINHKF